MSENKCSCCGKSTLLRTKEPGSSLSALEMSLNISPEENINQEDIKRYMGEYYVKGAIFYRVKICYECFFKAMGVRKPWMETK